MAKIQWKPGAMFSPLSAALISCGGVNNPNVMTASWVGMISSKPPRAYVSVRPERYSHGLIKQSGEFVINVTGEKLKFAADYCGVVSGRDKNKFEVCSLTAQNSFDVGCPSIAEAPVSMECRVFKVIGLGSHDMFLADITAVSVDDALIDQNNRLHLQDAGVISYIHGEYYEQGSRIGHFGWTVKKNKKS